MSTSPSGLPRLQPGCTTPKGGGRARHFGYDRSRRRGLLPPKRRPCLSKNQSCHRAGRVPQDAQQSHLGAQGSFVISARRRGSSPRVRLRSKWEAIRGQAPLVHRLTPAALHLRPSVCLSMCLGLFGERRQKSGFVYRGRDLCRWVTEKEMKSHISRVCGCERCPASSVYRTAVAVFQNSQKNRSPT